MGEATIGFHGQFLSFGATRKCEASRSMTQYFPFGYRHNRSIANDIFKDCFRHLDYMTFAFFPAVDLRGGKCVQLVGGVPGTEVVALDNPLAAGGALGR